MGALRRLEPVLPFVLIFALAAIVPLVGNVYWTVIATRVAIYWVLVAGLNMMVGYGGQLAIGYVALLAVGAYVAAVLTAGNLIAPVPALLAIGASAVAGALSGLVVGLPALRLRTFYFAMTTLGFATIVTQVAVAWEDVTGGGIGITGPSLPAPFDGERGLYWASLAAAAVATLLAANLAGSRFGRALVAIRDAEVAAEAFGVRKARVLCLVFAFAGALAGISGGLFASLQTYITPDAFTFELSVLFFIAILIGGRGSILGPLLGTIVLTLLPEFAAPLAAWSSFLYAAMLLVIVLAVPGGIASLLDYRSRRPLPAGRVVRTAPALVRDMLAGQARGSAITLRGIVLSFGGVRAIDGLDLLVEPGAVHGLIGPNGSGKTTTLNVISGYYRPEAGSLGIGDVKMAFGDAAGRAGQGIARTFQTPRIIGEATVLQNVMIGGGLRGKASFVETILGLPRHWREERVLAKDARQALSSVGLADLAGIRADRLQHSELRFLEIARALVLRPAFLLLDEPAAGLSGAEIRQLGQLIHTISRCGTGVLLVEHHADLIFEICDQVTVLNLGRTLAQGAPTEIRAHKEVINAYLGA